MDQRPGLAFGRCELDVAARVLRRDGRPVDLQPKVLDLLAYLIKHRDRVVSRDEILDALWPGVAVTPAALSRAVHKAREAVGDDGAAQDVIQTCHGHGFRFVAELVEASAPAEQPLPARSPVASRPIAADRGAAVRSGRPRAVAAAGLVAAVLALIAFGSRGPRDCVASSNPPPAAVSAALPLGDISDGDQQDLADGAVTVDVAWTARVQTLGFDIFTRTPIPDLIGPGIVSGLLGSYDVTTAGGTTLRVSLLSPPTGPPTPTAIQLIDATTSAFASGFPNTLWPLDIYGHAFTDHNAYPDDFGDIGELRITVPTDVFDEGSYVGDLVTTRRPPGFPPIRGTAQRAGQLLPGCSTSHPAFWCQVRILDLAPYGDAAVVEYRVGDAAVTQGQSFGYILYRFTVRRVCAGEGVGDSEECDDGNGVGAVATAP